MVTKTSKDLKPVKTTYNHLVFYVLDIFVVFLNLNIYGLLRWSLRLFVSGFTEMFLSTCTKTQTDEKPETTETNEKTETSQIVS